MVNMRKEVKGEMELMQETEQMEVRKNISEKTVKKK
jgi:hypothetical protein